MSHIDFTPPSTTENPPPIPSEPITRCKYQIIDSDSEEFDIDFSPCQMPEVLQLERLRKEEAHQEDAWPQLSPLPRRRQKSPWKSLEETIEVKDNCDIAIIPYLATEPLEPYYSWRPLPLFPLPDEEEADPEGEQEGENGEEREDSDDEIPDLITNEEIPGETSMDKTMRLMYDEFKSICYANNDIMRKFHKIGDEQFHKVYDIFEGKRPYLANGDMTEENLQDVERCLLAMITVVHVRKLVEDQPPIIVSSAIAQAINVPAPEIMVPNVMVFPNNPEPGLNADLHKFAVQTMRPIRPELLPKVKKALEGRTMTCTSAQKPTPVCKPTEKPDSTPLVCIPEEKSNPPISSIEDVD